MANLGLEFAINIGVADMLLDLTFRHLVDFLDEGHMYVVGVILIQTICAHCEVHVHPVRFV